MNNPKTTVLGWLLLLGAIINAAIAFTDGDLATNIDVEAIMAALVGLGFLSAKDNNK